MISLNTNLTSQLVASNLKSSSVGLNNAIERMTTGFKLNHAKDNAANFSISTSLSTKLGAYNIAQENAAMGLDMIQTASSSLSLMSNLGSRLHSLAIQANNGTYGGSSLDAIQSEASSIVQELFRIAGTTQYNGMYLFGSGQSSSNIATNAIATLAASTAQINTQAETLFPTVNRSGFIEDINRRDTSRMISLKQWGSTTALLDSETYSVSTADDLLVLSELVANGYNCEGAEIVLGNNIDLSNIDWTPIGRIGMGFAGTFDGNGYKISGLNDSNTINASGLFEFLENATVQNLAVEGDMVKNTINGGILCGEATNSTINNCYASGKINGDGYIGGLVGYSTNTNINNCYAKVEIESYSDNSGVGGLCGGLEGGQITNSFATGNILGGASNIGGLAGIISYVEIQNSYASVNVYGSSYIGGLIGTAGSTNIIASCYASGNVEGVENIGGLLGLAEYGTIIQSYATGNVTGEDLIGGLVGEVNSLEITECYTKGQVFGVQEVGGIVGRSNGARIQNSYSGSKIEGKSSIGGIIGYSHKGVITSSYFNGSLDGGEAVGGIIGTSSMAQIANTYADFTIISYNNYAGEIIGVCDAATLTDVYYTKKSSLDRTCGKDNIGVADAQFITAQELNELIAKGTLYGKAQNISPAPPNNNPDVGKGFNATLQVGIHGTESDKIEVSIDALDLDSLKGLDLSNGNAIDTINKFLKNINEQQTSLGAVENRLMSAIESIGVNIENLTSTQSTIRDADIAKESSEYIRNQILQQAAATLLATANQNPSVALQLL